MTQPDITERWVFGGSRVASGKRIHEWVDPTGESPWFKASGSYVVGSVYEITVRRDGDRVSMVGKPRYTGERTNDAELLDTLAARHRAAELALSLAAKERAARRDDPVDQAIARLVELAEHIPRSQRRAFAVYVATKLMR